MTAAAPALAPASKVPKYIKLTPKEWARIEAMWEDGSVTYSDLVKQYGKSVSTFERHFKKRGVVKGAKREETKKRVADELAKSAVDDATVLAARIKETKEEHYKMASALGRLTWNEILTAKQDKRPVSSALNNLKALDAAMTVLKKAREERFAVLGLDRTDAVMFDEVPELVISELTPEQVQQLRDRDHTDVDGAPAVVSEGDLSAPNDDDDIDDDEVVEEGSET